MAAYAARTGAAIISPPGKDGKRRFSITWYKANYNDVNLFCSDQRGGPITDLCSLISRNAKVVIDRVTVWDDATTAADWGTFHYLTMYLSQSTTGGPLSFSEHWWTVALLDVHVAEVAWPVDPFGANVLMLYSNGFAATDDAFIIVEGEIDG